MQEPTPTPTQLQRLEDGRLRIDWSDGARRDYRVGELRDRCPCATCREKRSDPPPEANPLAVLSPAEARPLAIEGMAPVGAYAYRIDFSDGHNTGLFSLALLRELGEESSPAGSAG